VEGEGEKSVLCRALQRREKASLLPLNRGKNSLKGEGDVQFNVFPLSLGVLEKAEKAKRQEESMQNFLLHPLLPRKKA